MGLKHLYAKHEGMNPSGSFKDRGMTVGVSMALQLGKKSVACASTGNTSASLAVYAAKAGIPAVVLLPAGKVAVGKVAQALMHGAKVISIRGNFDRALEMVHDLCLSHGLYLLNSINPYRLEGQKTIGFEALDQLGEVPDRFVLPVGNAGNISAVYKGFMELQELGFMDRLPMMTGIQAEGSSPVVRAIRENFPEVIPEAESRDRSDSDPDRGTRQCGKGPHCYQENRRTCRVRHRCRDPADAAGSRPKRRDRC